MSSRVFKILTDLKVMAWPMIVVAIAVGHSGPAMAYVGPGAGVTMLGALWAVVAGILLALAGLVIWPIRAFFHRRKQVHAANSTTENSESMEGSTNTDE